MKNFLTAKKLSFEIGVCLILLAAIMIVCCMAGPQKLSIKNIFAGPGQQAGENIDYEIFFKVRLARVILAGLVGAALACCGVALQAILRNPLADPYILGISSGAGLGVVLAIISGISWGFLGGSTITLFAFSGAIITVWLVWFIGRFAGNSQVTSLLLAGVVVNAFFSAVIMFLMSIAKNEQLRETMLWLMGNITEKDFSQLWVSAGLITSGIIGLFVFANKLNVLTFGDEQAESLGVNADRTRLIVFGFAAFITAVAVSLSGLVGFVGLIVPHGVRLCFGPDHRKLLPLSAIIGAGFLVVADTIARIVIAPAQLPAGVITAIAGGPFFLFLLAMYSRKVSWLK